MQSSPVGTRIVNEIAAREGVDPTELDVQLYDVVDADALDAITNGRDDGRHPASLRIEFTYHGYSVTVDGRGQVTIDETPPITEPCASRTVGTGD